MNKEQSSYRQIVKATSIFGGVQVFQILIDVIRSKFIAVLLGPLGMGISGLLTSTTGFIRSLTNFGLSTSAVRDVSSANASGNVTRLSIVITVFRRMVWITGLLGAVVTLVLSPLLSKITFGNKDYTFSFALLSITLLINQISSGQSVLLRGTRRIKDLAKASLIGSILGLFTTIPLYYFWDIKGIVPGIIITAIISLFLTWYYARIVKIEPVKVSKLRTIAEGKGMMKLGFMISLSSFITVGTSYLVRIFISNTGSVDDVGLYNAGFAIINTYVGLVFTAMGTDYYPRLSSVAYSNELSRDLINQQAEIALLILAPIIQIFLVFINWIVVLLYSSKFTPINDMILYAALGMLFRAASWSISFILLAKGASKLFFWNELIANTYILVLNILGYKLYGLTGMGISFMIGYILYLFQVYFVAKHKYNFTFRGSLKKIFLLQLLLAIVCLFVVKTITSTYSFILGSITIAISLCISFKGLDKRVGIVELIKKLKIKE